MAIDLKTLDEVIKSQMSKMYTQIKWVNVPIPEGWYKILTEYTAKYAIKIGISQAEDTQTYFFCCLAGDKGAQFAITKAAALEDVKNMSLPYHLDKAVKDMGLEAEDYKAMAETYKKYNMGFTGFKPIVMSTATHIPLTTISNKSPWNKVSTKYNGTGKLNSLYEMYGMVEPKIRYCKAHRPTAAQVWARIQEAEKESAIAKTVKSASPALKDSMFNVVDKYLNADNPFAKLLEKPKGGKPSTLCAEGKHYWKTKKNYHISCAYCDAPHPLCPGCQKTAESFKALKDDSKFYTSFLDDNEDKDLT